METVISNRRDALSAGVKHYFTGRPCIHGHLAMRYAVSGSCSGCTAASNAAARYVFNTVPNARREAVARLHQIRVRLHHEDKPVVFDTISAVTLQRHPALLPSDVTGKGRGLTPFDGCAIYILAVDPVDVPMVRTMENALHAKRAPDMNKIREQILGRAVAQASQGRDNQAGEWTFI